MKNILKSIGIILVSIVIGFILIIMVYLLPASRIENNLAKSIKIFKTEKTYERDIYKYSSTTLDNYTDALMLSNASYAGNKSIIDKSINVYRYSNDKDPYKSFILQIADKKHKGIGSYSRYWHGYLIVLKPLLVFFSYNDLRYINIIVGTLLITAIIYLMQKKKLDEYIPLFVLSILLINPSTIFKSLQYSTVFYIFNLAILFLLLFNNKMKKKYFYYFLGIGILTSYFDFLTYPLVTLGMPMVFLMILNEDLNIKERLKTIVSNSIYWMIGYAGMWIGKFALGTAIFGTSILKNGVDQIKARTSFTARNENINIINILRRNMDKYINKFTVIILIIILLYILYKVISKKVKINKVSVLEIIPFLIICLMPITWYVVLSNHSYIHHFFTYRTLVITIFSFLCGTMFVIKKYSK